MISNGVDIVEIKRFDILKKKNTFVNNIYTNSELEYIKKHNNKNETFAGIYALKEATLKSLKKGLDAYSLKDIEIKHDKLYPDIILHGKLKEDFKTFKFSASISHDGDYAIGFVLAFI